MLEKKKKDRKGKGRQKMTTTMEKKKKNCFVSHKKECNTQDHRYDQNNQT